MDASSNRERPMIDRIRLTNFKCLRDVTVDLGPLTVLIGPNDSGKTSLLDAIRMLGRTTCETLSQVFVGPNALDKLVWYRDTERSIGWSVSGKTSNGKYEYLLTLSSQGGSDKERLEAIDGSIERSDKPPHPQTGQRQYLLLPRGRPCAVPPHVTALNQAQAVQQNSPLGLVAESFSSSGKYHLSPEAMHQPSAIATDPLLSPNGDNLASVLDALVTGPDRSAIIKIEEYLRQ